jgi:hypothetical protein
MFGDRRERHHRSVLGFGDSLVESPTAWRTYCIENEEMLRFLLSQVYWEPEKPAIISLYMNLLIHLTSF